MTLKEMNNPFEGHDPRTGTSRCDRENKQLLEKAAIMVGLKFVNDVDLDDAIAEVQFLPDFIHLPGDCWKEIKERTMRLAPSEFTDRERRAMPPQDSSEINETKDYIVQRLSELNHTDTTQQKTRVPSGRRSTQGGRS